MRRSTMGVGLVALAALVALVTAGCTRDGGATGSPVATEAATSRGPTRVPYVVTATVGMVADIVRQVAGPRADVRGIIGEGVDPHLYKPTRGDVTLMIEGDVVFYSGLLLEGKMTDTLIRIGQDKPVYAVTELIDESYLLSPPGFAGHHDPHVWMDVSGWMKAVEAVAKALSDYDPAGAEGYQANAAAYLARLAELDTYARAIMATIPERQRVLVTAHDAFNYFGRAYGLEVLGIQGISTESEAGLEDINNLVDTLVEREIRAVFVESSVAEKNVRALIEGARSRGWVVTIGGSLYSDAMGPTGTYEGSYLGMIDHNATLIARSLGGQAPERGMLGLLTVGGKP